MIFCRGPAARSKVLRGQGHVGECRPSSSGSSSSFCSSAFNASSSAKPIRTQQVTSLYMPRVIACMGLSQSLAVASISLI
eukprot:1141514-Amphidinium_carterae.1